MTKTDLSLYNNDHYKPGGAIKRLAWYVTSLVFFQNYIFPISSIKVVLLRIFGAKVGRDVTIKPAVNIKYPWFLEIGDHVWVGEKVWIDNLAMTRIGSHVCLSQGAMLLTGNHNYKKPAFDLITQGIKLEDGVWIGAQATVCPGIVCKSHSILSVGSVATSHLDAYTVYMGNPAGPVRKREFK